jgi:UDP-N-acetylglucosamine transferase subunit ALG13
MHPHGFDRLVRAGDDLAAQITEPVVIQYGSSAYVPQYAQAFAYTTGEAMQQLVQEARLLISHAAAGTVINALLQDKKLVLVPRLKAFNESIDDHQLQLSAAMQRQQRAVVVLQPTAEALMRAIEASDRTTACSPDNADLLHAIHARLTAWDQARPHRRTR